MASRAGDFNSYGARRGNHEVMMRGTFANIRLKNEMVPGIEGGVTRHMPDGAADVDLRRGHEVPGGRRAAGRRRRQGIRHRLVARLGGQGHASCWACRRCIAESFERIHRSNLVGMGVLPLQFKDGMTRKTLGPRRARDLRPRRPRSRHQAAHGRARDASAGPTAATQDITVTCRIDTLDEVEYFRHGGILPYVLRNLMKAA